MDEFSAWFDDGSVGSVWRLAVLIAVALVAGFIARRIIALVVTRVVSNTRSDWDNVLHQKGLFFWGANLVPVFIVRVGVDVVTGLPPSITTGLQRASGVAIIIITILVLNALFLTGSEIYGRTPSARDRPIKGYVQILQIFLFVCGAVVVIATGLGESPWVFLSGIGAMTAVLLLVFKDTILSLVASVQLTSNDMIRVGDWIELPEQGADGDVVDIALHTVKVQNWDKTITTIPTYTLISQGFKNWRHMPLSGGRRIKRAVYVDVSTVRHLSDDEIQRFARFVLLKGYIADKVAELQTSNAKHVDDDACVANARRLTNLGTYRAYLQRYLAQHPGVNQELTCMVRHLAPTPQGLPVEIYCFSNRTEWAVYEGIQADIFDHVLAIAPEFGLQIYQQPSGADLRQALAPLAAPSTTWSAPARAVAPPDA